jgi:transposase
LEDVQASTDGAAMSNASYLLDTRVLGALPVVNHFLGRLGLPRLLAEYLPAGDRRVKLAPAAAVGVVVRNLVLGREPVYGLGRWAAPFEASLLGLDPTEVGLVNDDRVGRMLARLFDADRASLLTRLLLDTVDIFGIDTSRLHTDTTSIRFAGAYPAADGRGRGGKPTPAIVRGLSKDHRPDLKQLVWSLTVSADGAVPVCHRVAAGNTNDDVLHIPTWDQLVGMLGRVDFLYVADCKLCSRENMDHIHSRRGRFLTVLPATRAEDRAFRDWLVDHPADWVQACHRPGRRQSDPDHVWWTCPSPWPSTEGHRIVWVKSSAKRELDAEARRDRIARGIAALDQLNTRLASPKTRIKTSVAAEQAAAAALDQAGATRWITFHVDQRVEETIRQEKRGRPGKNTRYRKLTRTHHRIAFTVGEHVVARDAASDGCFPLITNDRDMTEAELLAAYKWQPNLEKRHAQLKGTQLVAPMFLHHPARIEALLCCHFIALLTHALIERQIRRAMADRGMAQLSVYPEDRGSAAPTAARVLDIFTGLARHHLIDQQGQLLQTFQPELDPLQRLVLDLLDIPEAAYLNA